MRPRLGNDALEVGSGGATDLVEEAGRERSLGGAFRRLSEGLQRREANLDDRLADGQSLLSAGELGLAFEVFGQVLLARPLDPAPLKELERIASSLGIPGVLANLYARLLQENPDHPSLGTLTRRIGRLRDMVAMAPQSELSPAPPARTAYIGGSVGAFELAGEESAMAMEASGIEAGGASLPVEGEAELGAVLAVHPSETSSFHLGVKLFGSNEEPAEAIDYELGTLLTSGAGAEVGDGLRHGGESGAGDDTRGSAGSSVPPRQSDRPDLLFLLRRGAAFGVDAILLGLVPLLILAVGTSSLSDSAGGFANHLARNATVDGTLLRAAFLLAALFAFIYCTLCWALGGRTLGGFIAGLRAVDRDSGGALSVGRAALRAGAAVVGTAAFLMGPLWALIDPAGETLHDKFTRSSVISG